MRSLLHDFIKFHLLRSDHFEVATCQVGSSQPWSVKWPQDLKTCYYKGGPCQLVIQWSYGHYKWPYKRVFRGLYSFSSWKFHYPSSHSLQVWNIHLHLPQIYAKRGEIIPVPWSIWAYLSLRESPRLIYEYRVPHTPSNRGCALQTKSRTQTKQQSHTNSNFRIQSAAFLVGGWTNHSQKCSSNWIVSPRFGVKITKMKTTPSYFEMILLGTL